MGNRRKTGTSPVDALKLKEGDGIQVRIAGQRSFEVSRDQTRAEALAAIRDLRRPLPPGWSFDRNEASERNQS